MCLALDYTYGTLLCELFVLKIVNMKQALHSI